ncbi:hypothetical protein [Lentilactobacillus sp. Marseille-Q4993]|uniref:hypothetical protein n=1 Tax=Lentilactobacillus sp. Marseille-Q4993 TaxID=3039492 RepID=UPI0024BD3080|nr:hypothetical protein [Lentilactobacillus sp. Marseille-Q4993]
MTTHKKTGKYKIFAAVAFLLLVFGIWSVTSKADYYSTKIKNSGTDDDYWVLTGTTKAPDDYYVVAVNKNDSDNPVQQLNDSDGNAVRVHNGEFSGNISAISATEDGTQGEKTSVYITAINPKVLSDSEKEELDSEVKTNRVSDVKNNGSLYEFTVNGDQAEYITSEDDDDSDDDEDTDTDEDTDSDDTDTDDEEEEDSSSDEPDESSSKTVTADDIPSGIKYTPIMLSTFERYSKKYLSKGVAMQGVISSIQHDADNEEYLISIVDGNYDHEFVASIADSDLDKLSYTLEEDDWVDVKGIGYDGFTNTNASGAVSKVPGILVKSIKLTP